MLGYGNGVGRAYECLLELEKAGVACSLVDLRFAKPLDTQGLLSLGQKYTKWFVFSDSVKIGGIGQILSAFAQEHHLNIKIHSFEFADAFIPHGKVEAIESQLGLSAPKLTQQILQHL